MISSSAIAGIEDSLHCKISARIQKDEVEIRFYKDIDSEDKNDPLNDIRAVNFLSKNGSLSLMFTHNSKAIEIGKSFLIIDRSLRMTQRLLSISTTKLGIDISDVSMGFIPGRAILEPSKYDCLIDAKINKEKIIFSIRPERGSAPIQSVMLIEHFNQLMSCEKHIVKHISYSELAVSSDQIDWKKKDN